MLHRSYEALSMQLWQTPDLCGTLNKECPRNRFFDEKVVIFPHNLQRNVNKIASDDIVRITSDVTCQGVEIRSNSFA